MGFPSEQNSGQINFCSLFFVRDIFHRGGAEEWYSASNGRGASALIAGLG